MIHIEELGIGNSVYLKDKVITIIDIISSESNPCIYYVFTTDYYSIFYR